MSDLAELLELERRFWLDSVGFCHDHMSKDAAFEFLPPVGRLNAAEALKRLKIAPRYAEVEFADVTLARREDSAMICYRVAGWGERPLPDVAFCSSTYRRGEDGWQLVNHRREPAPADEPSRPVAKG